MIVSQRIRGRAAAFRLDVTEMIKLIGAWDTEHEDGPNSHRQKLVDRKGGYTIAAVELEIIADELERDGK